MQSKSDSNVWLKRRTLPRYGTKSKEDAWPELQKPKHSQRVVENTWPELRKCINKNATDDLGSTSGMDVNAIQISGHVKNSSSRPSPMGSSKETSKSDELTKSRKEEKKQSHKMFIKTKQEALRQEKRREKEENALRKLVGPKGLSISVIDPETFSKFTSSKVKYTTSANSYEQSVNEMTVDSSTFPELSKGLKKNTKSSIGYKKRIYSNVSGTSNEDLNLQSSSTNDIVSKGTVFSEVPCSRKTRKKKDPVVVDILKAIEICKVDKKEGRINGIYDISGVRKTEKNTPRMTGNILDSSNPFRHRGKKREVPKKRNMTRLKKAVMAERERRRPQREIIISDPIGNRSAHAYPIEANNEFVKVDGESSTIYNPVVPQATDNGIELKFIEKVKEEPLDSDLCENSFSENLQKSADPAVEIVDVGVIVREKLHSKKFREYCNHSRDQTLSEVTKLVIRDIIRFQDRLYINQPIKAESHRRYVLGLRQTQNLLSVQKVKFIVMASDIEKVPSPGGLDDIVSSIIDGAKNQNLPVVFSFQRRQLGKLTYRKVPVSCIGILNYQGTETNFQGLIVALEGAKKDYLDKFEEEKSKIMNEIGLLNIKKEDVEPDVQPLKVESSITLPLLQKLTEAISEISVQSSFQMNPRGDI